MQTDKILSQVKEAMLITGDFQDKALRIFVEDVMHFLEDAGVDRALFQTQEVIGVIVRGVIDLWNYGSGSANFSDYFLQRTIQLVNEKVE